jgi:transcription elongation factor GreA
VELGAVVEIVMEGYTKQFTLVGSEESDLANGKLSFFSPMGKALVGKKKGDECVVTTPKGSVTIVITNVT